MAAILLEETSPLGNVVAVAEDDDRVVYFYLHFLNTPEDDPLRVRSCWVRNRLRAPQRIDEAAMERGEAPLMPAAHCLDPDPGPPLDTESLRVIWLEELDAAALVENDESLAIIPAWSGVQGFQWLCPRLRRRGPTRLGTGRRECLAPAHRISRRILEPLGRRRILAGVAGPANRRNRGGPRSARQVLRHRRR